MIVLKGDVIQPGTSKGEGNSVVGCDLPAIQFPPGIFDTLLGAQSVVFKAGGKRGLSRRFRIMIEPFKGEGR